MESCRSRLDSANGGTHLAKMSTTIVIYMLILQMIQFGVRRGKEGIAEMKVENFAIKEDDVWGIKTWAKVGLTIHEFPTR